MLEGTMVVGVLTKNPMLNFEREIFDKQLMIGGSSNLKKKVKRIL